MATEAQLIEGLRRADKAGNVEDAQRFAAAIKALRANAPAELGKAATDIAARVQSPDTYRSGLGASFAQGVMGGLADETAGVMADSGLLSVGPMSALSMANMVAGTESPRAAAARDAFRKVEGDFAAQNPMTAIGANIAGSLVSGYGLTKAAPAVFAPAVTTPGQNIMRGAAAGAGAAGVTGFNSGQGGLGERLKTGAIAAPIGGALGASVPAVISTYRGIVNAGARPANVTGTIQDSADAYVGAQMARDGMDPAAMRAAIAANPGKPVTMADLGGENTLAALDMAVNRPGPSRSIARDFFRRRQTGKEGGVGASVKTGSNQAERLAGDVKDNIADASFFDAIDALAAKRAKDAKPLYDEAYAVGDLMSPQIFGLLKTPTGRAALKNAERIAGDEVGALAPDQATTLLAQLARVAEPNGTPIPMRVLDLVKRGMDDVVEGTKDPLTGKITTNEGRAANGVRAQFRQELIRMNPKYGEALDAWAGPTAAMNTIRDGREAFASTLQPEQVAQMFAKLGPQEQNLFLIGAARHFQEKVAKVAQETHDASKRIVTGTEGQKLAAILPRNKARAFVKAIEQERAMYSTSNVLGGSATARRLANEVDADTFESMLADGVTGQRTLRDLAFSGIRWVRERGSGIGDEKVRERITRMLLSDDPRQMDAALTRIERQIAAKKAAVQQGSRFANIQGLAVGSSAGNFIGGR